MFYFKGKKEPYQHIERALEKIKIHREYDTSKTDYDVALIKFRTPVDLSLPHIRTICLPKDDRTTYTGKEATVTGWGMTTYNGATSNVLRAVNIIYKLKNATKDY